MDTEYDPDLALVIEKDQEDLDRLPSWPLTWRRTRRISAASCRTCSR